MSINPPSGFDADLQTWLLVMLMAMLSVSCGQPPRAENAAGPTPQAAASASPIPWATIEPPTQAGASGEPTKAPPTKAQPPVGPRNARPSANARTYSGTGVVRLINLEEGWLEIDHEEIPGFMPAMQMEWSVTDRAMLKSVQVGDKVNFTLVDDNGTEFITKLTKVTANP